MSKEKEKRIPDYARRDIVGIYYSQMKMWQFVSFILAISTGILVYIVAFKEKYRYFYTDGVSVVEMKETSPKVDAFVSTATKKLFSINYQTFDDDVSGIAYYTDEKTYQKIQEAFVSIKADFINNKKIWIPTNPQVSISETQDGKVIFTAKLPVREIVVKTGTEGTMNAVITGEVITSTPNIQNLYPYRLTNIKISFGG